MKPRFVFLILVSLLFLSSCNLEEKRIEKEIEAANYCDFESDCVDVGGKCPFGCYILVNKDKADYIKALVEDYDSLCVYSCIQTYGAVCANNKCESRLEPAGCTQEAKICEDGSAVGRNASLGCEFNPCPELIRNNCSDESRKVDACIELYQPVCGWNGPEIQCFRYPCASTYSNSCFACQNEIVEYWTDGECPSG